MSSVNKFKAALFERLDQCVDYAQEYPLATVAIVGSGAVALALSSNLLYKRTSGKKKPSTVELSGGFIEGKKVKAAFDGYSEAYGSGAGEGIAERGRTSELVNTFYHLVTDIYEWGWGQSFHFSPKLPNKDLVASEAAHETRLAALLKLKPGMKCLDVGCGVGGPMRVIAPVSGAHVTGITINGYQVERATYHNKNAGLAEICSVIQGDFLRMPFEAATYDAAYAIEATCHAAELKDVYGEIYRVLKPGALFTSYEWVGTKLYDPSNAEHVRIMDEINFGNGLPEMRTYKEAEDAGKAVGFDLVNSYDIATMCAANGAWYNRLKFSRFQHHINHAIVTVVCALGLAPKGVKDVHKMLIDVAHSLVEGGETGVFSPMHLLVFKKPEAKKPEA